MERTAKRKIFEFQRNTSSWHFKFGRKFYRQFYINLYYDKQRASSLRYGQQRYATRDCHVFARKRACAVDNAVVRKMMQRTKTKLGRYKPYILFLAPIVAVLGVLAAWSPQSLTQNQRIIYVYMICTPTIFLWNLWYNTFNMFPGVFTPNQQERADIWSPIGLVIGFAPTIMNAVKGLVIAWKGDIWAGRIYGILSAVLGMVCIIALLGVKERVFITEEENKSEKVTALEGLKMIVKKQAFDDTYACNLSWQFEKHDRSLLGRYGKSKVRRRRTNGSCAYRRSFAFCRICRDA